MTIIEPKLWPAGTKTIVLTFDDGPNSDPRVSNALLDILQKHQVPAVFCYVGKNIIAAPEIVKRAHNQGHQIAIHTFNHNAKSLLSKKVLRKEIIDTEVALRLAVDDPHFKTTLFRPPVGLKTPAVRKVVNDLELDYAQLTFFKNDAKFNTPRAYSFLEHLKKKILQHNGAAIVLHETRYNGNSKGKEIDKSWLPQAVEKLIVWAKQHGFKFATYKTQKNPTAHE